MDYPIQVVFDCAEPDRLARFWAATLGYRLQDPPQGFASWEEFLVAHGVPEEQWDSRSAIVDPDGRGPRIFFQRVPESKMVKNRLHLDVSASGGPSVPLDERRRRIEVVVERVVSLGAMRLRAVEEGSEYHVAMQDPEGNEFDIQ